MWVYLTDVTTFQGLFSKSNSSSIAPYLIVVSGGSVYALISSNGTSWNVTGDAFGNVSANTWTHIAWVWTGTTYYGFVNGVLGLTVSSSATPYASAGNAVIIGNYQSSAGAYNSAAKGYIDEVRYSGTARWTANFAPPTQPYPGGVTFTGNVQFKGTLNVGGSLTKGSGTFVIDHPLDPKNTLLFHSFVESPDAKNIYDGIAKLDKNGEVRIFLPAYFDALNTDVRYQWLAMYQAMPNLYIKEEEHDNQFVIAGGPAGGQVSWQITGVRRDPYILMHPIMVEVLKGPGQIVERGKCLFAPLCK
jgi:hypothetical protein